MYAKKYGVIQTLPNFAQLVPSYIVNGATLQGTVGRTISLKLQGKPVSTLKTGQYTIVATDNSKTENFHLSGPGSTRRQGSGRRQDHLDAHAQEGLVHVPVGCVRGAERLVQGRMTTRRSARGRSGLRADPPFRPPSR